jgi:hypothetical protein
MRRSIIAPNRNTTMGGYGTMPASAIGDRCCAPGGHFHPCRRNAVRPAGHCSLKDPLIFGQCIHVRYVAVLLNRDNHVEQYEQGRTVELRVREEQQKPWGSLGCVSERGGLGIVGGHSRIQGSEQIMKRTIQPKLADAPRFLVLSCDGSSI